MATRVNKLLSEINIGLPQLKSILDALDYKAQGITMSTQIQDGVAILVRSLCSHEKDLFNVIEEAAAQGVYRSKHELSPLTTVGYIDLDEYYNPKRTKSKQDVRGDLDDVIAPQPPTYSDSPSFWISELAILSSEQKVNRLHIGAFEKAESLPLYSVLIGTNGVGKSSLMKEIIDFFIDLHSYVNHSETRLSPANKGHLKGIRYNIDGVECEVIRLEKNYYARVGGAIQPLTELRLPSIVACHFGAFDKFPTQKVNGLAQTRYDVDCYKYVGAHVNGNMISSSAIAFRLLFALNEHMDDRQRKNICSILDFIGYDHRISLSYTMVTKSKKNGVAWDTITQRVDRDRDYANLNKQEKARVATELYNFYISKTSASGSQLTYDIDFDGDNTSGGVHDELQIIYKLKQCDLVNSVNVIFHKQGIDITSDEMSSGEFAMLSTVLSVSAAANDPHTLVLMDEPELSLHPNWQMMLIDNLDRALDKQVCHLVIATHSHFVVSDLQKERSSVTHIEKDNEGNLKATTIAESTFGWSPEEVLLKVFQLATDRNRYLADVVGTFIQRIADNDISIETASEELTFLKKVSTGLSDVDPMKKIIATILEEFENNG